MSMNLYVCAVRILFFIAFDRFRRMCYFLLSCILYFPSFQEFRLSFDVYVSVKKTIIHIF